MPIHQDEFHTSRSGQDDGDGWPSRLASCCCSPSLGHSETSRWCTGFAGARLTATAFACSAANRRGFPTGSSSPTSPTSSLVSQHSSLPCQSPSCFSYLPRAFMSGFAHVPVDGRPNKSLQPTPGSGYRSAARFTSLGPAWLSFFC